MGVDQLLALLARLAYPLEPQSLADTVDYYLARTAHGSTLSRVGRASVLARLDPARARTLFRDALAADLGETQGGTTEEGVHLGAMAGTVDILTGAFAGMKTGSNGVLFEPRLPEELRALRFQFRYHGQCVDVAGTSATLRGGEKRDFPLDSSR